MASEVMFYGAEIIRSSSGGRRLRRTLEPLEEGHETRFLPRRMMERIHFALILKKLRRYLAHKDVCSEFLDKLNPAADPSGICDFRGSQNTIGHRLLALVTPKPDSIQ
jgi:hypothetical protein